MNPTNYRPISLLTSFSKVFEKALFIRLLEHFYSNKLLVGNLFGFRKGVATDDATFKLTNEFLNALNNKAMAGSIFCHLQKAFDSVNHDLLLLKLPYYGISCKTKLLLISCIQNRYQRVQIINSYLNSNRVSKWTKIKYGVPQGSILGPLLFLVYINDLLQTIKHKVIPILFADDTSTLVTSPKNIQFQNDLNVISGQLNKWFNANLLSLNSEKTYLIHLTNRSTCTSDTQITYEDTQICTASKTKFLGPFVNNTLSWKTHIECSKSKLSTACYAMWSVKPYVSLNTLKMTYYSYFHSVMTYGLLFSGHSSKCIKIFRLKKIIRIIMGFEITILVENCFLI